MERHIVALGGGGFSDGTAPGVDRAVLALARRARPRVGFLGTASGDSERYRLKFYEHFAGIDCEPSHLSLFGRVPDVAAWCAERDVLYVGGGNTKSLLALWGAWGLDEAVRSAWQQGVVLAGVSAGAICWFEEGVTDSAAYLNRRNGERIPRLLRPRKQW